MAGSLKAMLCIVLTAAVVNGAPSAVRDDLIEMSPIAKRSNCNQLYTSISYAIWKNICTPRKSYMFTRRFEQPRIDVGSYRDAGSYDRDENNEVRENDLLMKQFSREARDGEAQFDAPMYVI